MGPSAFQNEQQREANSATETFFSHLFFLLSSPSLPIFAEQTYG
jgi:hypothetical protein